MPVTPLPLPAFPPVPRGPLMPLPMVNSTAALSGQVARHFNQARRDGRAVAVLWLELEPWDPEGFPLIYELQESVQSMAAQRLRNRVRNTDEVVRVGDVGYAVVLPGAGQAEADLIERRLCHALQGTYGLPERQMRVMMKVGSALFPADGQDAAELAEVARRRLPD